MLGRAHIHSVVNLYSRDHRLSPSDCTAEDTWTLSLNGKHGGKTTRRQ